MTCVLGCLLAYLLGGIPFGLVLVLAWRGVDVRTIGSGNIGATNASRAFGGRWQLPVFLTIYLLDFAKGFLPAWFGPGLFGGPAVLFGSCAILGHCASPFLRLRGGKGVATTTGVVAALDVRALLIGLAAFVLVRLITGQVFLGSLALAAALAMAIVLLEPATAFGERLPLTVFGLVIAVLLVFTHRSNLRRMFARRAGADSLGGP